MTAASHGPLVARARFTLLYLSLIPFRLTCWLLGVNCTYSSAMREDAAKLDGQP